ncbi:unnamed protein product [Cyprideis torosa]|uniref:Uncharacterized protein n=1 Tax=Cyprideis torosa TaxID=163714 RepID=A0A7R8ZH72_9CRUS|nr:unnamed protein product [Cyprideis torosa]CAG0881918.1 unnamed protein product [Cyprideis torosa]
MYSAPGFSGTFDRLCDMQVQGEENTHRQEEGGEVVLVKEHRITDGGQRKGYIVIKGTPERLMQQLVEENSVVDPTYVEDFLLAHRIFIPYPTVVAERLLTWFQEHSLRDRVTRVVLLWVNNHFTDFELDPGMMEFLVTFESGLEKGRMLGQLKLLSLTCSNKARARTVTLARPDRNQALMFTVIGGFERGTGLFVNKVDKGSRAEEVGLRRGDQLLEVNGQVFENISHAKALEILRGNTHLSITVKSNLQGFKELLSSHSAPYHPLPHTPGLPDRSLSCDRRGPPGSPAALRLRKGSTGSVDDSLASAMVSCCGTEGTSYSKRGSRSHEKSGLGHHRRGFMTLGHGHRAKIGRMMLGAMNQMAKGFLSDRFGSIPMHGSVGIASDDSICRPSSDGTPSTSGCSVSSPMKDQGNLISSRSNPDLTISSSEDFPQHHSHETTAREVVMLALREFGVSDPSSGYCLCEVSVSDGGIVRQKRLPDQLQNLSERIGLSSRYYLKNNMNTDQMVTDDLASDLEKENQVSLLSLKPVEVAIQLTLQDFAIFSKIECIEYINELFDLKGPYGTPMLSEFSQLVNKEMFWVVTEITSEGSLVRRQRLIKHFIKIARQCRECRNFNSMFAIVSGLGHAAVSRLRASWDRVPQKYLRLYKEMESLMDPSRNMARYRNLLASEAVQPPLIPFWPVVKKDLTFIHLGNDTWSSERLVNFEKMRMIAKEVRSLTDMCSAPYDLLTMMDIAGQPASNAMVTMNQLTTGDQVSLSHVTKRRKRSTAQPNPKVMFEEAQMVRRVKAYLSGLKIIENEEILRQMSLSVEGVASTGPGSSATLRRRTPLRSVRTQQRVQQTNSTGSASAHGSPRAASVGPGGSSAASAPSRVRQPSPTLSTTSSTSAKSAGLDTNARISKPKFGTASPQSLRKMLALSEPKKKPHIQSSASPPPTGFPSNPFISVTSTGSAHHDHSHSDPGADTKSPMALLNTSNLGSPSKKGLPLNMESSSVTSLGNLRSFSRKALKSSSSVDSSPVRDTVDKDSGHGTDSVSNTSSSTSSSHGWRDPRRRHSAMHSPSSQPQLPLPPRRAPLPPESERMCVPVLPPLPRTNPVPPPIPTHSKPPLKHTLHTGTISVNSASRLPEAPLSLEHAAVVSSFPVAASKERVLSTTSGSTTRTYLTAAAPEVDKVPEEQISTV